MADTRITGLTELATRPASADLLTVVDVSDTTMAGTGTNKKLQVSNLGGGAGILYKFDGTAAPTVNEDSGDGYAPGSWWFDLTNDKAYVCLDSTVGAAVWTELGAGGGAPADAKYIVQEANGTLSAEQSLGALTTGILKNTVAAGVGTLSTAVGADLPSHNHAASDINSGTLAHERGGIEADISAVVKGDLIVGTGAGTMGLKNVGTDGHVLTADSAVAGGVKWAASGSGSRAQVALISDTKAQNTNGGTFTAGAWQTRDLNTENSDPNNLVTISANQFTLVAGEYLIEWSAPGRIVDRHQSRLYDVTNTAVVGYGQISEAGSSVVVTTHSTGRARVNISGSTAYRIEHQAQTTGTTTGFGAAGNFASEVYTIVTIIRLGDAV